MRPQCEKADLAPCTSSGSLNLCSSFSFRPFLLWKDGFVCFLFSTYPSKDFICAKVWCQAIVLQCLQSVFTLYQTDTVLTTSPSSQKWKKIPPMCNRLQRNRTFPESSKKKMQWCPHFLPTHPPGICSRLLPPRLFFKVPSYHGQQAALRQKRPQSLCVAYYVPSCEVFANTANTLKWVFPTNIIL